MYSLVVYASGEHAPLATVRVNGAAEALDTIPRLLAEHHGCERIAVMLHSTLLFSVDCAGNTTAGG